mmetsp:Transcript_115090/g.279285  ORF Transcript_115090/g.279285 Transcript_115090/m.279285 type:complete len:206 (-) Transcript_115090:479-1096(-)
MPGSWPLRSRTARRWCTGRTCCGTERPGLWLWSPILSRSPTCLGTRSPSRTHWRGTMPPPSRATCGLLSGTWYTRLPSEGTLRWASRPSPATLVASRETPFAASGTPRFRVTELLLRARASITSRSCVPPRRCSPDFRPRGAPRMSPLPMLAATSVLRLREMTFTWPSHSTRPPAGLARPTTRHCCRPSRCRPCSVVASRRPARA